MKIIYGKELTAEEKKVVTDISLKNGIMYDTARLLYYRGVDTPQKANLFLNAGKGGFHDPFLMGGMKDAVNRIVKARENGENVLIFGDYDADGICATTVLYYCLKQFGITARTVVPEREDGYGLNINTIIELNKSLKIDLLLTVDCGISDREIIEQIKKLGIDVIVTDHHEPPELLPDCICVNPKIEGDEYPFCWLCGAGVAYKLGYALIGDSADEYLDVVSLATVADSMDLVGENRDIVVEGLKLFNTPHIRLPFKYLVGDSGKKVTAQTLAYNVAPKINAGGRMGDAACALRLFLSTDENEIFSLTAKLFEYNIARQNECDAIYKQAKEIIVSEGLGRDDIILVAEESWRAGFIGIVAAKLVEEYRRPVIVFAGHDGYLKGSARTVDGINIHETISSVKELLIGYGGHSQAAGVSVSKENFPLFKKAINERVKKQCGALDLTPVAYADWEITNGVSAAFAREIELLEPFGVGNRRPIFTSEIAAVESLPIRNGSAHYTYKIDSLEILDFNGGGNVYTLSLPIKKKVLFEINLSVFRKKEYIKGYAKGISVDYGDYSALKAHIFENELKKINSDGERIFSAITMREAESINGGYGTLFAVSDVGTLKKYPRLKNLTVNLFQPELSGCKDCIVISPKFLPDGYDRIIYLDKPIDTLACEQESLIVDEFIGYKLVDEISVERDVFAEYFNKFKALSGKPYNNSAEFCERYVNDKNVCEAVFALTVFIELGILLVKDGRIYYDPKIKNPLTNSKVYSKIYSLKV